MPSDRLCDSDATVLDALVQRGFASDSADARSRKLLALLGLLDTPVEQPTPEEKQVLVDVTMARVLRAPRSEAVARISGPQQATASVSPADESVIDEFVESGWSVGTAEGRRPAVLSGLLGLLGGPSQSIDEHDRDRLVRSTMDRIASDEEDRRSRLRLDPARNELEAKRGLGMRLADLGSIAAVLLIGAGVLWPLLVGVREHARITGGQANLSRSSIGFTLYAADNGGKLPSAPRASLVQGPWWDVGESDSSHSANLYTLVSQDYASMHDLSSPGNPSAPQHEVDEDARDWRTHDEVSFSYLLFRTAPQWGEHAEQVVLTDRSPVVKRAMRGEAFLPTANSLNHPSRGQNVLFADGRVSFFETPFLRTGDNLWIPTPLEGKAGLLRLQGTERADSPNDAFVGP